MCSFTEQGEVIYQYSVLLCLYKSRKAAVMSKAFHGVINIWQNTWPFYQTNIFAVSFLYPWCEPCVTLHYRLLLLSRTVLSSNQLCTFMQLILSLWDHELKLPLMSKDKAFIPPVFDRTFHLPQPPPPSCFPFLPAHASIIPNMCIIMVDSSLSCLFV